MNRDQIEGNWEQFKGKVKEAWGKLTDDEIDQAEGNMQQLSGIVQKKYGLAKEKAEEQINEYSKSCGYKFDKNRAA